MHRDESTQNGGTTEGRAGRGASRDPIERIVCLTEEPTEILYLLGEQDRIVGISAYTVRPPEAKRDKPVVSAFVSGSVDKIAELKPDLVVGFSDIQADLAKQLIARGLQVLIFNQRSVIEILDVILSLGRLVGAGEKATEMVASYKQRLRDVHREVARRIEESHPPAPPTAKGLFAAAVDRSEEPGPAPRPRVYFEEWMEPTICGIRWVSELIELAGGVDVFAAKARGAMAKDRIVTTEEIVDARPDIYIASWCGKPFDREVALARPGFDSIPAVREGRVIEMDPAIILQPGPACLTDGLDRLVEIIRPVDAS